MRRFRFRMQPLLRLRSQFERMSRKELAAAMAEVNGIGQQVAAADRGLADCADQAVRSDSVGALARSLEVGLKRHLWRLRQQQKLAEQKLDMARTAYATKARELKTMQRLRDQQHEQWQQERLQAEQAAIDEAAVFRTFGEDPRGSEAW